MTRPTRAAMSAHAPNPFTRACNVPPPGSEFIDGFSVTPLEAPAKYARIMGHPPSGFSCTGTPGARFLSNEWFQLLSMFFIILPSSLGRHCPRGPSRAVILGAVIGGKEFVALSTASSIYVVVGTVVLFIAAIAV